MSVFKASARQRNYFIPCVQSRYFSKLFTTDQRGESMNLPSSTCRLHRVADNEWFIARSVLMRGRGPLVFDGLARHHVWFCMTA